MTVASLGTLSAIRILFYSYASLVSLIYSNHGDKHAIPQHPRELFES